MKKTYFYFHAGSGNHGCEAIVRSTVSLLENRPVLISATPEQDFRYSVDELVTVQGKEPHIHSILEKIGCAITSRILKSEKYGYEVNARCEAKAFDSGAVAFSIGGDNYCYGDAYNMYLAAMNRQLKKRGIKTVLWGCSIEPDMVTAAMRKDFSRYDLIVARESISYEILKSCNPNTMLVCDPAFRLDTEMLPLPDEFLPGKTIGINLSPLIQKSEKIAGITKENYRQLIRFILEETDYHIALIPHVVCNGNDDRVAMEPLLEEFQHSGRICMIQDCNCQQLKGYIARCRLFIGARTHATIAAYSTYVPTLVIGYSTKATGIARDLFSSEKDYVLPVQELSAPDDIRNAFVWLDNHHDEIAAHLQSVMPDYVNSIQKAVAAIDRL